MPRAGKGEVKVETATPDRHEGDWGTTLRIKTTFRQCALEAVPFFVNSQFSCFYSQVFRVSLYTHETDSPADEFPCATASTARVPRKTESRGRFSDHRRAPRGKDAALGYTAGAV